MSEPKTKLSMLAIIPARGGSKGLPRKNLKRLGGIPLIAHSIKLSQMCPDITRCIVTTDDPEIATYAKQYGADVPFLRPDALADDDTPTMPVLRHALETLDPDGTRYDLVLLLEPTSPGRLPSDVRTAYCRLSESPEADGIIGVHRPEFNPIWHAVTEQRGTMKDLVPDGGQFGRRQDAPPVYRIDGSLYIWRSEFVSTCGDTWRPGNFLMQEVEERQFINIDNAYELEKADAMIRAGLIDYPWLSGSFARAMEVVA
jgi:CMP-N,N'-diacetyllegionaminic acid synthase